MDLNTTASKGTGAISIIIRAEKITCSEYSASHFGMKTMPSNIDNMPIPKDRRVEIVKNSDSSSGNFFKLYCRDLGIPIAKINTRNCGHNPIAASSPRPLAPNARALIIPVPKLMTSINTLTMNVCMTAPELVFPLRKSLNFRINKDIVSE